MKGVKILGGCLGVTMLGVFGFIILSTMMVEAARQASPFGKNQIRDWMMGTPQPVAGGREHRDNGYFNAGVGVGWEDYGHPTDQDEPRGVPFNKHTVLKCVFRDPLYLNHTGVDFSEVVGTPVITTMSGLVVWVGNNGNWGGLVVVENNGFQIYYAHLSSFSVSKGAVVDRGQIIGEVGNTGNSSGPHLHYGIKKKTGKDSYVWVDPQLFFHDGYTKAACPTK